MLFGNKDLRTVSNELVIHVDFVYVTETVVDAVAVERSRFKQLFRQLLLSLLSLTLLLLLLYIIITVRLVI